ncbi:MAG: MBL fold metallo-hydrolase [Rhodospirillales bacterium]|uniref:MBL fold metallo-hydrolase n=1 Tax=Acidiphilium sp. TaxID=527 RepID=UPI0025899AF9|nr:MBL fold metallo-hydrolase [Acidiphilium sp.]MBU6357904.1 MBL fold metallo-hydrolase [Rhodospirillales bacterium]
MSPRNGHVTIHDRGNVCVHDYQAPQDGLRVHSLIVEGPTRVVLFDAQFLLDYATEVADYIDALAKPLDRIILSHGHPDHWSGLEVISKRFPGVEIATLPAVRDYIVANGQEIMTARQTVFGTRVAAGPVLPTTTIAPGKLEIDGVRYVFEAHDEGESQHQLVVTLPDQAILMAFDLIFPANVHTFTVAAYFDHWIAILNDLASRPFETLLVGHAGPARRTDIQSTIAYLETARDVYGTTDKAEEYATRMKAAFPDLSETGWIDFASLMLYGIIDP